MACLGLIDCSTTGYRQSADEEVYGIISEKSPAVEGMVPDISIDYAKPPPLDNLAKNPLTEEDLHFLGEEAANELGAPLLTLEEALRMAFQHSRQYQDQKENLYLEALSLTLDRYRFAPIFSGAFGGDFARSTRDQVRSNALGEFLERSPALQEQLAALTGTPAELLGNSAAIIASAAQAVGANPTDLDIVNERSLSGRASTGFNVLFRGGGRLAVNLTANFMRFLTGAQRDAAASVLSGSFVQPLLRGRGRSVSAETLTQAERDVLYELRRFTRFRKTFAVQVASRYYGILNNRDAVRNNYDGLARSRLTLDREIAMAAEGESRLADVGRAEQNLLNAQTGWINATTRYAQSLDNFKILLGLSTDVRVVLNDGELDLLAERGLMELGLDLAQATAIALVARLDLQTDHDRLYDSERQIRVAANALQPDLDIVLSADVDSKSGNRILSPDFDRARLGVGFDVDLPLDRKAERNNYRRALIAYERQSRGLDLAIDEIKLNVRDAWRTLGQARSNYDIALKSLELSERRVEEQNLRADIGLGDILDLVDAQNDLTSSENSVTSNLVTYTIALLDFWRDMGILYIKEDGQWEELEYASQIEQ